MAAEQTMTTAEAYARELDQAEKRFSAALANEALTTRDPKASRLSQFPLRSLTWLALAPTWPRGVIERAFPGEGGVISGPSAIEMLVQISAARVCESGTADDGSGELYWMSAAQRSAVVDFLQILPDDEITTLGVRAYIRSQLTAASKAMIEAEEGGVLLTTPLQRWAQLAANADSDENLAKWLRDQIEEALKSAKDSGQIISPEALRWIEAASPFVGWLGTPVEWAVAQAGRRIELFYREAYDGRSLKNYFVREHQEKIFTDMLPEEPPQREEPSDKSSLHWALHYVGLGGTGKTMLMRRISAQLAEQLNLAVARIDFDRLNPDYPARAPGLLLSGFAEELRLHATEVSADLFLKFDHEVETLHESIEEGYETNTAVPVSVDDYSFQRVLRPFIEAVRKLSEQKRVVLVLDTCEELAKIRSGGELPDSVRVTFDILERIHDQVTSLRVIFSGRRPLASAGHLLDSQGPEKKYNWTCPTSELPARDYLQLYEIRGFTRKEALAFLPQYTGEDDAKVNPNLFEAILKQSCSADKSFDSRFEWHDGRIETDTDSRFNPYDLDMFAEWTCADSTVGEQEISAGATQYVKDRIIKRADYQVKRLLPEITLLGRFDEKMMKGLMQAKGVHSSTLFSEFISQEWLDIDRSATQSGTVWAMDNIMRSRLRRYYETEERPTLSKAAVFIADFMSGLTLERDWKELSPAYFVAALSTLGPNKVKAGTWWEAVEKRLAESGQWPWAKELTDQLLVDDGPAARADASIGTKLEDESVLRPAILATQAAAVTHLWSTDPGAGRGLLGVWTEVLSKADRHPTVDGALRLKHRAVAGTIAAYRWQRELQTPGILDKFLELLEQLPRTPDLNDEDSAASEIAMLEAIVEVGESLALDSNLTDDPEFAGKLSTIYLKYFLHPPDWLTESLSHDLVAFFTMLRGRLQKLCGQHAEAIETFNAALEQQLKQPFHGQNLLQQRLDWQRPDDLTCRINLEYIRGMYPAYVGPDHLLEILTEPTYIIETPSLNNADGDRLFSAFAQLKAHCGFPMASQVTQHPEIFRRSLSWQSGMPYCNAHRQVPGFFSSELAAEFAQGRVAQAVDKCLEISKQAENSRPPALRLQKAADRALLRMAARTHLRDERGAVLGGSLEKSELLDDISARFYLYALDGAKSNETIQPYLLPDIDKERSANLTHIGWRSGKLKIDLSVLTELGRTDLAASFVEFALALDAIEGLFVFNDSSKKETEIPQLEKLVASCTLWAQAHVHQPVQALTLYLRAMALTAQFETSNQILDLMVLNVGRRRAAEIAEEEGTLLSLRIPGRGLLLLEIAHAWYLSCGDSLGQLRTSVSIAMLHACLQNKDQFQATLVTMKAEYLACFEVDQALPLWDQLVSVANESKNAATSESVGNLMTKIESLRSWRPLVVRVLGCLIREQEFSSSQRGTKALMTWIEDNYSTTISEGRYIPPDLSYLFTYKEAPIVTPAASVDSAPVKARRSRLVTLAIALLALGVVIGLFLAFARLIQFGSSYVRPISFGMSLLIEVGLIVLLSRISAIWRWYVSTVVTVWTRNIVVESDSPIKDPNRPLLSPLKLRVMVAGASKVSSLTVLEPSSDDSYRYLARALPEAIRKVWTRANKWAYARYIRTKITVDENSAAAPWEAIVGLAPRNVTGFDQLRLICWRNLKVRDLTVLGALAQPVKIVTLASSVSQTDFAQKSWRPTSRLDLPIDLPSIATPTSPVKPAIEHSVSKPGALLKGVFADVDILHLIGTPRQTTSGVRLEIYGVDDTYEPALSSEPSSYGQSSSGAPGKKRRPARESDNPLYLMRADEVSRSFPRLRICVVQRELSTEESRDSTSRDEAGLLRRFGAELFKYGIPAVILLPPLGEDLAVDVTQHLRELMFAESSRGRRRWWQRRTALAGTVRKIQETIALGYPDAEKGIEIAFDACLYMVDRFDLNVDPSITRPSEEYR